MQTYRKILTCIITTITLSFQIFAATPHLTIGFIVDQFAYHYLEKIEPHLTGGIKMLLDNGVVYNNAYMPHASPGTAIGHVAINTGTFATNHGITGNYWVDENGNKVKFEQANIDKKYAVFSKDGLENYAMAPYNIMTDGISDQFVLRSQPGKTYKTFGIAHKSRAAIGISGTLGKAIWFDAKGKRFTSSKAYFETLPTWLKTFNATYLATELPKAIKWELFHKNPLAYNFYDVKNYNVTNLPYSLISTPFNELKPHSAHEYAGNGYAEIYIKTPHATKHLLELAKRCIDNNLSNNPQDRILLWISLSPLDPLGHYYGPQSQECLDLLYHIDRQIKQFMEYVENKVSSNDILYLLTADHGVMPIIEILQERGLKNIHRINSKKLTTDLNQHVKEKHDVENMILRYQTPQFYVNKKIFYGLSPEKQKQITKTVKTFLENQPGIMRVWTQDELQAMQTGPEDIDRFFKKQFYPGRSGEFTCKCNPYSAITKHPRGTHHRTPYNYDTHVPLVIHQRGTTERKVIEKKVWMTQVANTLAKLLNVARPSASLAEPLPEV